MKRDTQANKWHCKICGIWIADNKPQRDLHENGQRHKAKKLQLLKDIEKKNNLKRKETGTVNRSTAAQQLLEIAVRRANVSKEQDVQENSETNTGATIEDLSAKDNDKSAKNVDGAVVNRTATGKSTLQAQAEYPAPANEVFTWKAMDNETAGSINGKLDENGYPEPVSNVYGWEPVENTGEGSEAAKVTEENEGLLDTTTREVEKGKVAEADKVQDTEEEARLRAQLHNSFKRRKTQNKRMAKRRR